MTVSRAAVGAVVLAAVAVLLAIGLFVAGAMWRARVTGMAGPRAVPQVLEGQRETCHV